MAPPKYPISNPGKTLDAAFYVQKDFADGINGQERGDYSDLQRGLKSQCP